MTTSDSPLWLTLYHSALLELDPEKLLGRILAAETACEERRKLLREQRDASTELHAIADAEQNLLALRRQLITPSIQNDPSHMHPELNGECIAVVNRNRQYVAVSDGTCRLLGYSHAELIGKTIDEIAAPEIVETVPAEFEQYVQRGFLKGEFVLVHRSGRRVPIKYEARVFPDGCLVARWQPLGNKDSFSHP